MPAPDELFAMHLADMRLRGLAEDTTIYARRCAIARLAEWLKCYHEEVMPIAASNCPRTRLQVRDVPSGTLVDVPRPGTAMNLTGAGPGHFRSIEDATAADLLAWRTALTVSPKSVGPYVDHVRGYYAWLVKTGYRADNPAAGLPVPRGHRGLPRPIREDDLWRALDAASRRVRPWLALAAGAGLRAREIAYLRRENVDDTAAQPFILVDGKGGKERVVPVSTFVLAELKAYGLPARGLVFRRHDGLPGPNKPWLISKLANDCLHRSGTNATLHQLRHRCLSLLYQQTLDLRLVQELAGHSSPATTAIYTLVSPARAAEAVEALPAPRRLRAIS